MAEGDHGGPPEDDRRSIKEEDRSINHSKDLRTLIQVANQRVNKLLLNIRLYIHLQFYRCTYVSRMQVNLE